MESEHTQIYAISLPLLTRAIVCLSRAPPCAHLVSAASECRHTATQCSAAHSNQPTTHRMAISYIHACEDTDMRCAAMRSSTSRPPRLPSPLRLSYSVHVVALHTRTNTETNAETGQRDSSRE